MSEILAEFEEHISADKEVLAVLPINTKRNKDKYLEKVDEFLASAQEFHDQIWEEMVSRCESIVSIEENPRIKELAEEIENVNQIEFFNELNTPYEKLGLDKIIHNLQCFFEGSFAFVNKNIKEYIDIFEAYGIKLTEEDFTYSQYTHEYMKKFFKEVAVDNNYDSDALKKHFETIYWKCPDIVTHLELNMRYLYNINSKKFEKAIDEKNKNTLTESGATKNELVKKYFELSKELMEIQSIDKKSIIDKFASGEWKSKDFNDKAMSVLFNKLCSIDYYAASEERKTELNKNFAKLLRTLQEYKVYMRYKYILDDLEERAKDKDNLKASYENTLKELNQKEKALFKENKQFEKTLKMNANPFFKFLKKKLERKIYEFPVASNTQIREIRDLYIKLDDENVNLRIAEFVDDSCSIKYMFKIAMSFYAYAYNVVKMQYRDDTDVDVGKELDDLIDFINQPYKVMLNNIKVIEEPEISLIISNRYKILNINLEKEDLEENFESLVVDVEKIVDYNNILRSGVSFSDIEFVEKVKQMMAKK